MKTFEAICKMTQMEVKAYMKQYLTSLKYNVVDEDGFLYARGSHPVLLVAHMDTVHKELCKEIKNKKGKLSSPQGIGGDDRCGIFIIMNLVKEINCSVLLCEDEEIGGVGAKKFTKATYDSVDVEGNPIKEKYINNLEVNYMVEFDRRGNNDAVYYSCDNKDFIDFVTDYTGFKKEWGSFSDISSLMPAAKLAAVNLSSGYYNAHTTTEYVVYDDMMNTIEKAKLLINAECAEPFEYVARQVAATKFSSNYTYNSKDYGSHKYRDDFDYYESIYDRVEHSDKYLYNAAKNDRQIELEVVVADIEGRDSILYASGNTKSECWMELFMDNPNLCFNDILDYSWC